METNRIGDVLVEKGKITRSQIKDAILYKLQQKKSNQRVLFLGEALIELGFIEAKELMLLMQEMGIKLRVGEILVKNERISYNQLQEVLRQHIEGLLLDELVNRFLIQQTDLNDTLSEQTSDQMTEESFQALFGKFLEPTPEEGKKTIPYVKPHPPAERNWMTDPEMCIPDSVRMNDL